ncbi:hypothetical protein CT138_03335 [Mannheimia varigena]|uniref:DUF5374 domain-containing protein n=1 Tax=Mannheimia varigena TaxID=85404 RepID=UPI000DBEF69C|nr:DUF5374 domain-containing protein [Mannheimia varigena]AWW33936.1 hypothetical protein CT138_03335 [Mannheimia varigena]MDY2947473.1 DUF5374 domain-containing protein [Mannheimia varigena]QLD33838.1 DUF5374 domain-containing protein [Mannheimia varigena]
MNKYKAESTISLLVAIALFTIVVLSFSHWQSEQNRRVNAHFQQQQAAVILENQIALQLSGLDCERQIEQNNIRYDIQCSGNKLSIRFPLGKIELNND